MDEELKKRVIDILDRNDKLLMECHSLVKDAQVQIERQMAEIERLQMLLMKERGEKEFLRLVLKDTIFGTNSFGEAN
jgi:hypothetical protein